jgi:hypothetical protein
MSSSTGLDLALDLFQILVLRRNGCGHHQHQHGAEQNSIRHHHRVIVRGEIVYPRYSGPLRANKDGVAPGYSITTRYTFMD